ncbi:PaaI family thioesterase [Amnimonas aquatica]|uniref:Thioesterase n=1 Tax=Amnimonas aquatica TaxID=2094561 RepID=A0A2P6AR94_9GAMM|nr:PaaI family thioesterase [Amnimonas aquatica]PQA36060.1 thioesterase [Amnimonas aquatica]
MSGPERRLPENFADVLAESPYAQLLGVQMQEGDDGLLFVLPYQAHNIGNDGLPALHGGVIGGFLETAALLHLLWVRESVELPRTVDFSIDYLRSGKAETLYAQCSVTKQGKRVANVLMTAWQESRDKPVAVARAHFLLSNG